VHEFALKQSIPICMTKYKINLQCIIYYICCQWKEGILVISTIVDVLTASVFSSDILYYYIAL